MFGLGDEWVALNSPSLPDRKRVIKNRLESSTLGLSEEEMYHQVERLFAPDAFLGFLDFIAHFASNNMLTHEQVKQVFEWITSQSESFLKRVFAIKLPAVQACFETLLRAAIRYRNSVAYRYLFNAVSSQEKSNKLLQELLLGSVELGIVDIVEAMLEKGVDVNTRLSVDDSRPRTFLGAASTAEVALLILNRGANVDAPCYDASDRWVLPPVYRAARFGRTDLFHVLLKFSATFDPNFADNSGMTLLGCAIERQDINFIKFLLDRGATCRDTLQKFEYLFGTELQLAAHMGDEEIVSTLLATPSARNILLIGEHRWGPLRDAARQGHTDIVGLLIQAGADVNATSDTFKSAPEARYPIFQLDLFPCTALLAAVEGGHIAVVNLLLNENVDVNSPMVDLGGRNALELAIALGHSDIVFQLVVAGARLLEEQSIVELHLSGMRNDAQKARRLVDGGADPSHLLDALATNLGAQNNHFSKRNILSVFMEVCGKADLTGPKFNKSALQIAIEVHDLEVARRLILDGAILDLPVPKFGGLLQFAVRTLSSISGGVELIRLMLERGANVNGYAIDSYAPSLTAPQFAACESSFESFEFLPSAGAGVSRSALEEALRNTNTSAAECIQLLLNHGANVNGSGIILQKAIEYGHSVEVIQLLLDNGADINNPARDVQGRTALQMAIENYLWKPDIELVTLLLERGADINAPPARIWGVTALQGAAIGGHLKIVHMLLERGADVNAPPAGVNGVTALEGAAMGGHLKIAHMLLERGADPNAPGSGDESRTALEGAAKHGRLDMVQLLLNAGAAPTELALKLAEGEKHFVIANILRDEIKRESKEVGEVSENQDAGFPGGVPNQELDMMQQINPGFMQDRHKFELDGMGYLHPAN